MKARLLLMLFLSSALTVISETLQEQLNALPGVKVETKAAAPGFTESYILTITQPLDHRHPEKGTFTQRAFLSHRGFSKPMVMTTEGYSADYANNAFFEEELANILQSNQLVVEHRYFSGSKPEGQPWDYLTVENAAADHHHVIELLKTIYKGKWITTGISKGGQTAVYHRTFYPNDADATVAYVAPYNIAQEDPREIWFLKQVGDSITRSKITTFQRNILKQRSAVLDLLKNQAGKRQYT
ncbi:MAG: aminopeptidase, partial [Bacteroidetes bacterium HGW-Bacteroidetes-22]